MGNVVLWLHIVAAGAWIGTNIVQAVTRSAMAGTGPAVRANWERTAVRFGTRIYTPAGVLLLLTGIELIRRNGYSYADTFVLIGIAMVVVGGALGATVFAPTGRAAADAIESGDVAAERRIMPRLQAFGILDTVLVLLTTYAMVAAIGA